MISRKEPRLAVGIAAAVLVLLALYFLFTVQTSRNPTAGRPPELACDGGPVPQSGRAYQTTTPDGTNCIAPGTPPP